MDSFGDHALTCPCRGDRTRRHNSVRDLTFEDTMNADMAPEREKLGLLPSRPSSDDVHTTIHNADRRPADIWLPRGAGRTKGRPEALDFAVTSGLRADNIGKYVDLVFANYELFKEQHENTKQHCENEGFVFTPVVFEAHGGGWSSTARRLFDHVARQQRSAGLNCKEGTGMRIAQRISTAIQLANSRAVLKRLGQCQFATPVLDLEAADFDEL